MNSGIFSSDLDTFTKLSKSDSDKLPLLISFELIFACSDKILVANCSADISNEKNATLDSVSPSSCALLAILKAMLVANDVFP